MTSAIREKNIKRRGLRTAILLYIALLSLALTASFAWFITTRQVSVGSNDEEDAVKIAVSGGNLQISFENSEDEGLWAEKLAASSSVAYYMDLSGDGLDLWYPRTLSADDKPNLSDGSVVNVTGDSQYYVDLKVYFRTSAPMDVYLSDQSYVKDMEEATITNSVDSYERQSMYGNFSCDGIVGAARVAFVEETEDDEGEPVYQLKNLWIPNDNIQLSSSGNTYSLSTSGASEALDPGYCYISSGSKGLEYHQISAKEYAEGKVTITRGWKTVTGEDGNLKTVNASTAVLASKATEGGSDRVNQAAPLLSFAGGSLETKILHIRLWFEGCDREASSAFSNGMACYDFTFLGISKDDCGEDLMGSGLCYNAESLRLEFLGGTVPKDGSLAYSVDGIAWYDYSAPAEGSHPVVSCGQKEKTIFVRAKETASSKPGKAVEITIPAVEGSGGEGNE